jgi:hypothetical protein
MAMGRARMRQMQKARRQQRVKALLRQARVRAMFGQGARARVRPLAGGRQRGGQGMRRGGQGIGRARRLR